MFPLSASNEADVGHKMESKVDALTFIKNELKELYFEKIQRLREYKLRVKEQSEGDNVSDCVKRLSAELVATTDKQLLLVRKRIQDSRMAIHAIKDMIEKEEATRDGMEKEEEEIETIAEDEKSNEEEFVTIAVVENSRRATREVIEKKATELESIEKNEKVSIDVTMSTSTTLSDLESFDGSMSMSTKLSDECLDHVDSIEKKEQDLDMIDNDEHPFAPWNKKSLGFAYV